MPHMIRVSLQNRKRPINLLEYHHPSQLMRQGHATKRQNKPSRPPSLISKPIAPADRNQQRHSIHLLALQKSRQLLRRILLPARVQQNQLAPSPICHRQKSRLVLGADSLNLGVPRDPLQILIGQTLNRGLFRLPDPSHFDLHDSRSPASEHHIGPKPYLVAHAVAPHRRDCLSANRRPIRLRNPLQHRPVRSSYRARIFEHLFRVSQPSPRQVASRFLHLQKSRRPQNSRQRSRRRISKRIGPARNHQRSPRMPLHNLHRRLPVRLLDRAPSHKARARPRLQNASQFPQCPRSIRKKHHPKPAGSQIEIPIRKRKRMRIRLPSLEIHQPLLPSPLRSNLQQFCALIDRDHRPARSHQLRQANAGLSGPGSKIKHAHPRRRPRILHKRLRYRAAHVGRLGLPLFRRYQTVRRTPRCCFRIDFRRSH